MHDAGMASQADVLPSLWALLPMHYGELGGAVQLYTTALLAENPPRLNLPAAAAVDAGTQQALSHGTYVFTINDTPALYTSVSLLMKIATMLMRDVPDTHIHAIHAHTLHIV